VSRRARSLAGSALVLALVLTACSSPGTEGTWGPAGGRAATPAPARSGQPLAWRDCEPEAERVAGSPLSGATYSCATLAVPQDWAEPGGATFDLALLRIRSDRQDERIGSLLVNPGGPGGSGWETAVYLSLGIPTEVMQRFDLIGFDPRGVARSSPVECISDRDKDEATAADPDPESQAEFDAQVRAARAIGEGCARKYGEALPRFATEQAARDMDAIRAAVGDEKLTYLGYSYGTLLGAVYAQLFPGRVRALVLDGAVDPEQDDVTASEGQAAGFEKAFDNFAADCRAKGSACPLGPNPRAVVQETVEGLQIRPLQEPGGSRRTVTGGHVLLAVVAALYVEQRWAPLAKAVADVRRGDPTGVLELADDYNGRQDDGSYDNSTDANLAVNCADEATPPSVAEVRRLQGEWRTKYPLFGSALALSTLGCAVWPGARDPYPTGRAEGSPPILVVGTVGDPATPYANTGKLAAMLGVGRVLTWAGEGHTAYPQTRCIAEAVNRYLIDLTVPAEGTRCPAR